MAGGLVGLLDDVAALAKLAAASIDDVSAAAGRASLKAAGVVIDDTAVTPSYVQGLAAERELPIIAEIAKGSLRNKLLFILPVAIALSELAPLLVEILLIAGGTYLCYEGGHKIVEALRPSHRSKKVPDVVKGVQAERATVSGAIRTDFILSAEIMVISLKEVIEEPLLSRAAILVVVAVLVTVLVYGVVAAIVKMDDIGLALAQRSSARLRWLGRGLVRAMPIVLLWLSRIGVTAMLWVGGHILIIGAEELGWSGPYRVVHDFAGAIADPSGGHAVVEWIANTGVSALVGLMVGLAATLVLAIAKSRVNSSASDLPVS